MSESELVGIEWDDSLATLIMQSPPHNLLGPALMRAILDAAQAVHQKGARAIRLKSGMKHFSGGADLTMFSGSDDAGVHPLEFLETLETLPIPIVAQVHGAALGGGLEVALACDIIVAGESSRLGAVEVTLGLAPLMGGVQRLTERVGAARAKEIAMLGRRYDAQTFERLGIINHCVADRELDSVAVMMAKQLANGPTVALNAVKQIANAAARSGVEAGDHAQGDHLKPVMASEDLKRGLAAFAKSGAGTAEFEGN